ncbi:hypothetical protein EDD11_008775, partial [Mortierella claussenii]
MYISFNKRMRHMLAIALTAFTVVIQVHGALPLGRSDGDDFCVYFYKKPHYRDQAGFICGSLVEGGHLGRHSANIPVVASLSAPDWLQVTLYDQKAFKGHSTV